MWAYLHLLNHFLLPLKLANHSLHPEQSYQNLIQVENREWFLILR